MDIPACHVEGCRAWGPHLETPEGTCILHGWSDAPWEKISPVTWTGLSMPAVPGFYVVCFRGGHQGLPSAVEDGPGDGPSGAGDGQLQTHTSVSLPE